jgi:hypothetical protein
MKILLGFLLLLLPIRGFALTKPEALALSKARIAALSSAFQSMTYTCFVFEKDCQIETRSQETTLQWISYESSKFPIQIQYDSGPDKFTIDGALRIAKTGTFWGAPVIFNEDLLTHEGTPGSFQAVGLFEILGVLVHEYGHHQETELAKVGLPRLQHQELDILGAKVVTYLKNRTRQIRISKDEVPSLRPGNEVTIYQTDVEWYNGVRNIWSHIFIDGIAEVAEISQALVSSLTCPKQYISGHLTFVGEPYYAAFRKVQAPQIQFAQDQLRIDQEIGEASVLCVDKQMGKYQVFGGYKNGHAQFVFRMSSEGKLIYQKNLSKFTAEAPPDGH